MIRGSRGKFPGHGGWAVLAVCLLHDARAADVTAAVRLPPVEVTAVAPVSGLTVPRDQLPFSVQSATAGAIRESQAGDLTDFLARFFGGVNVNNIPGGPFQADVTFRGYRASALPGTPQGLAVYLDGVRINEPFGDVVNWDLVPEAALAGVTLAAGSNPVFGLNSLGGALVLNTKSGLSDGGFDADLRVGDHGRKRADLAFGHRNDGGWHAFAATTLFEEDGWREHSPARLGSGFAKVGRVDGRDDWNLSVLYAQSRLTGNGLTPSYRYEGDAALPGLYEQDRRAVYTWPDTARSQVTQATLSWTHALAADTELSALAYFRTSRRDGTNGDVSEDYAEYVEACEAGFRPDGEPVDPESCPYTRADGAALDPAVMNTTTTRQRSAGFALTVSRQTERHRAVGGTTFDWNRTNYDQFEQAGAFTADREAVTVAGAPDEFFSGVDGTSRAVGVFASDTWTIVPGTYATGSVRWNWARVSGTLSTADDGTLPRETFSYAKINPALGVAQTLGPGLTLFGGFAQNTRVPTAIELGCANPEEPCRLPVGLQADPYLAQVVAQTFEVGARWRAAAASADLSVYRTRNRDDILFLRAANTQQGYFANFPRTLHQGVDVSYQQVLGALSLAASYSHLDATYDAYGTIASGERTIAVVPGMRIAGLPRNTFKLALDWRPAEAVSLGADLVAVSDLVTAGNEDGLRADPAPGRPLRYADASIPGWAIVNVRGAWRIDRRFELYGSVSNVFDKGYKTYGALAEDMFPDGTLLQPAVGPGDAATARFVAPGAPRTYVVGIRYRY
jgi:outer membrane receptor protein involved in Fe transport